MNTRYKNVTEAIKALKGKKVKIIASPAGVNSAHGYQIGTIVTVSHCNGTLTSPYFGYWNVTDNATGIIRGIYGAEFDVTACTIEDLDLENVKIEKQIKDLKDEIRANTQKINFMKDNGLKEFDETDFKVYSVLETLETEGLTKVERAKLIAKLIKE